MTDVIVCDGFVGNVILNRQKLFIIFINQEILRILISIVLILKILEELLLSGLMQMLLLVMEYPEGKAIMNMILQTWAVVHVDLAQKIKEAI